MKFLERVASEKLGWDKTRDRALGKSISFPSSLWSSIDLEAGRLDLSRSDFIETAVRLALAEIWEMQAKNNIQGEA